MEFLTIEAIAEAVNGELHLGEGKSEKDLITGVVIDNRLLEKGNLFIPVVGQRVDGHDFIDTAFEQGALAVLSQKHLTNPNQTYIFVEDTLLALRQLGEYYRKKLSCKIVGVIGSVGKTSTKEMVARVLEQKYCVQKTKGNLNNEIGLPLTLLSIRKEHDVAVVEMGISEFGEMDHLGQMARPDYVVMTNIGPCHLETLGDLDGVLKAKTEFLPYLPKNSVLVVNGEDEKLLQMKDSHKIIYYGLTQQLFSATVIPTDSISQTKAMFRTPLGEREITIPLPGNHNILNALAAMAVATELGLTLEEMVAGIEAAETIAGRNHCIQAKDMTIMDDCYNASPISMKAAIDILKKAPSRQVAILGDMGELGAGELQLHYEIGEEVGNSNIAVLITVGKRAREIAKAVASSNSHCELHSYDSVEELLPKLFCHLKPKDTVLVKASHFMGFEKIIEEITKK